MTSVFHSCILSRHTEAVPSHRLNNGIPLHLFKTRDNITYRVISHMSHMQFSRWIWKHFKNIVKLVFVLFKLFIRERILLKKSLPSLFYRVKIVYVIGHTKPLYKTFSIQVYRNNVDFLRKICMGKPPNLFIEIVCLVYLLLIRHCSPFHERPYLYARSSLTEMVNMRTNLL